MSYELIISDIEAGGGAIIDLYYDEDAEEVKEEKIFIEGAKSTIEFDLDDFDPEMYGCDGEDFLEKIGEK